MHFIWRPKCPHSNAASLERTLPIQLSECVLVPTPSVVASIPAISNKYFNRLSAFLLAPQIRLVRVHKLHLHTYLCLAYR